MEEWRPVPGWEGIYSVSSCGRIRTEISSQRVKAGYILKTANSRGYRIVPLNRRPRKPEVWAVHILVAKAFIDGYQKGLHVNHIDFDTTNNRVENLEWVTPKQNIEHTIKAGRKKVGSQLPHSKLTENDVRMIRASALSHHQLAQQLGVSDASISMARLRKTWKHVT